MSASAPIDVLIIGSGPVGLTAAVEAKRLGLSARIIERKAERSSHDSRALVVQSRVLELLEPMGSVVDKIVDRSFQGGEMQICFSKDNVVTVSLDGGNWGDTKYPFPCFLPQYDTEKSLEEELNAGERSVEYGTSLEALKQDDETGTRVVRSTLRRADGTEEIVESKYVVGCDGGRSKTREQLGIDLKRSESGIYFVVADVKMIGDAPFQDKNVRLRLFPRTTGTGALFSLPGENEYRILFQAPKGVTDKSGIALDKEFFENLLRERTEMDCELEMGAWQTMFEVTHGIASSFSKGRVFLAGDACHVHSPVGGQGMNYGMQDAINLLWKLAWAERAAARDPPAKESVDFILSTYGDERHAVGMALIQVVDIATLVVTTRNWFLQLCRNFIMHNVLPVMSKDGVRTMGQLDLKYDPGCSKIIVEKGFWDRFICKPGERLPNLRLKDGSLLHSHVDRVRHTWIFLNMEALSSSLGGMTAISVIPVDEKEQTSAPVISQSTLMRPQVLLVRPDLWVAGCDKTDQNLWKRMSEKVDQNSLETM